MKLIAAEFRKLVGARFLLILLMILLAVNAILCYYTTETADGQGHTVDRQFLLTVDQLCRAYNEDPDHYETLLQQHEARMQEYFTVEWEKSREDPDYVYDLFYSPTEIDGESRDSDLLFYFGGVVERREQYERTVQMLYEQALSELRQLRLEGVSTDSFVYRYQSYVFNRYAALATHTEMYAAPSYGWDAYFSDSYSTIFLFAAMLLLASLLFIPEKQSGMLPILRSTGKGRFRVGITKMAVGATVAILITVLFSAVNLAVIFLKTGLADPSAPVQCLKGFTAFPLSLSILEYFFLSLFLRVLACTTFALLVGMLSVIFYQYLLTYVSAMAGFGVCFLMGRLPQAQFSFLKLANLLSLSQGKQIASRLYAANFFEMPLPYLPLAIGVTVFLCLGVSLLGACLYAGNGSGFQIGFVNRLLALCQNAMDGIRQKILFRRKRTGQKRRKMVYYGIFGWELRKILRFGGVWILLPALLVVQIYLGFRVESRYVNNLNYNDYLYYYAEKMEGELTNEKIAFAESEIDAWRELTSTHRQMQENYVSGLVSQKEYRDFMRRYTAMAVKSGAIYELEQRTTYLKERYEQNGIRGWYIEDEGIKAFSESGFSLPLYLLILIFGGVAFSMEYAGKSKTGHFALILRATKKGRAITFRNKCLSVLTLSSLAAFLFYGIEVAAYLQYYSFPANILAAPLCSIKEFASVEGDIRIWQYLLLIGLLRLFSAVTLALFITALSALNGNLLSTLSIGVFVTMIPTLISRFGLEIAKRIDFSAWFSGNEFFLTSAQMNDFGSDYGALLLFTVLFSAITVGLTLFARKKFCTGG